MAILPRAHWAQPGDILGGQNAALLARGEQRTGALLNATPHGIIRPWTSGAPRLGRPPHRCGKWGSGGAPGAPQDTLRLTLSRGRPCAASLCLSSGPIPKNRRHVPLRLNRGQPFLPTWWPSRHPDCLSTLPPWGPAQGWWTQRADAWVPSSLCSNCDLSGLSFPLYKRDSWGHSSGAGPRPVLMPSL